MTSLLTPDLCRAGRAILNWTQADLAAAANMGLATLKTFERGTVSPMTNNLLAMQAALERGGVEFRDDDGGVWMRLRPKRRSKS